MSNFETIESALLVTATGGAGRGLPTTAGEAFRRYAPACGLGAAQQVIQDRPQSAAGWAISAGVGCVTGVGNALREDLGGR